MPHLFHSFIFLTEKYSGIVDAITTELVAKESDPESFMEMLDIVSSLF